MGIIVTSDTAHAVTAEDATEIPDVETSNSQLHVTIQRVLDVRNIWKLLWVYLMNQTLQLGDCLFHPSLLSALP